MLSSASSNVTMSSALDSSTLGRFNSAKQQMTLVVGQLKVSLEETAECLRTTPFYGEERGGDEQHTHHRRPLQQPQQTGSLEAELEETEDAARRAAGILEAVSRDAMKVVFVGRTSTGKSTTINAMLENKILPSGVGHTTNCFCTVRGVDQPAPYLTVNGDSERKSIADVKQLAHALYADDIDPRAAGPCRSVDLFWPRDRCPLLYHGVEIIDSPGLDLTLNFDSWIDQFCTDADVFILVANAESAMNLTEKRFFRKVREKLSAPNLFVVYNRWDCMDDAEDDTPIERVRQQHFQNAKSMLVDELGIVDDDAVADRIFFVSSREALRQRTRTGIRSLSDDNFDDVNQRNANVTPAKEDRLRDFERFESSFEDCISSSAIRTRFESHAETAHTMSARSKEILEDVHRRAVTQQTNVERRKELCRSQLQRLRDGRAAVEMQCTASVKAAASAVQTAISRILQEESEDLVARPTKRFRDRDQAFNPNDLSRYTHNLSVYVEGELQPTLVQKCSNQILEAYQSSLDEIKNNLVGLVPRRVELAQLRAGAGADVVGGGLSAGPGPGPGPGTSSPLNYGAFLFLQNSSSPPFNPSFAVDCSALSETFRPDVKFRFSLGISMLMPRVVRIATPFAAHFGIQKELGSSDGNNASNFDSLETLSVVADVFRSPLGAAAVTIGSMAFTRSLPLKLVVYGSAVYGTLYLFEWACYTRSAQINKLKQQFVEHVDSELRVLARHRSYSCGQSVQSSLLDQTKLFYTELDALETELQLDIRATTEELATLAEVTSRLMSQHGIVSNLLTQFDEIRHRTL